MRCILLWFSIYYLAPFCFSLKKFHWHILSGQSIGDVLFQFLPVRKILSLSSHSEWQLCQVEYSWLEYFSFQHFESIVLLPSGLHSFRWKNLLIVLWGSLVCKKFSSCSTSLAFDALITRCLVGPTLGSSYLELCELPGSDYLFPYPNNGTFPPFCLQISFLSLFLSLLLLGFHNVKVSLLDVVP